MAMATLAEVLQPGFIITIDFNLSAVLSCSSWLWGDELRGKKISVSLFSFPDDEQGQSIFKQFGRGQYSNTWMTYLSLRTSD